MTERVQEEVQIAAGEEKDFIRNQRNTIADLYAQLKVQEKRRQDLKDKFEAYQ